MLDRQQDLTDNNSYYKQQRDPDKYGELEMSARKLDMQHTVLDLLDYHWAFVQMQRLSAMQEWLPNGLARISGRTWRSGNWGLLDRRRLRCGHKP